MTNDQRPTRACIRRSSFVVRRSSFVAFALLAAAPANADRVDDYLRAEMAKQQIPGLSVAVVRHGKVVKAKGFGFANLELRAPATPKTVYKIASVSKQFIAAGIMLLVQDGKIGLDDPIAKHLKETPPAWSEITVRHLLTMTSGLVRDPPGWSPVQERSLEEIVRAAHGVALLFSPGETGQYCNLGYFMLADIIERISGKPWGDFLRERIFEPLGMANTQVVSLSPIISHRADSYLREKEAHQNAPTLLTLRPSGGLQSTVLDLARWDAALYTERPLNRSSQEQMWTPFTLKDGKRYPYGFGWSVEEVNGRKTVSHSGGLQGFRTHIARFLSDRLTVIVLANGSGARPDELARGVAALYVPALRVEEK